jgi:indole-3-glycerol phosphate synthase
VRGDRRFSHAISEGDAISVIVRAGDADTVRAAASQGAGAVVVPRISGEVRSETELPILRANGSPAEAAREGADAWLVAIADAGEDDDWLVRHYAEALGLGLDCVVEVRTEEELQLALERLDPEILLLSAGGDADADAFGRALELLPDVPAGKLAVADVPVSNRDEVVELERAGFDAVIVGARNVGDLVGDEPPPV